MTGSTGRGWRGTSGASCTTCEGAGGRVQATTGSTLAPRSHARPHLCSTPLECWAQGARGLQTAPFLLSSFG
eukprot:3940908-Rhodomonas_salina.5